LSENFIATLLKPSIKQESKYVIEGSKAISSALNFLGNEVLRYHNGCNASTTFCGRHKRNLLLGDQTLNYQEYVIIPWLINKFQ